MLGVRLGKGNPGSCRHAHQEMLQDGACHVGVRVGHEALL